MALGQNHDIPSGHKQAKCEVGMSNVSPLERFRLDTNNELLFSNVLELAQMNLSQNHDTPSGH